MLPFAALGLPMLGFRAAVAAGEIAQASLTTIGARLPMLAGTPTPATLVEAQLMVTEKLAAAAEGQLALAAAGSRFWNQMACGRTTPWHVADAMLRMSLAASEPTRRTVRANARRLGR